MLSISLIALKSLIEILYFCNVSKVKRLPKSPIMKTLLLTIIAIFTISISVHSQTMEGTYTNTWESDAGGGLTYSLTLKPDNTFQFVSHRVYENSIIPKTITVNGTWRRKHRLLILATEASSDDNNLLMKLNNNRARFKVYSPRHRKYGEVQPSFRFFRSEVFYAKGMKLIKEEVETVANNF